MSDLYETDVMEWSEHQAALLRRLAAGERVNDQVDWPNVIEEIETVGRSERTALGSQVNRVILHLMKLEASPATDPRRGWLDTIDEARAAIDRILEDSPSLRRELPGIVQAELRRVRKLVQAALDRYGETPRVPLDSLGYAADQVIGDWLPPDPRSA